MSPLRWPWLLALGATTVFFAAERTTLLRLTLGNYLPGVPGNRTPPAIGGRSSHKCFSRRNKGAMHSLLKRMFRSTLADEPRNCLSVCFVHISRTCILPHIEQARERSALTLGDVDGFLDVGWHLPTCEHPTERNVNTKPVFDDLRMDNALE